MNALPSPDLSLSPYTGWTRAHHLRFCEELLHGVVRHLDPASGVFRLPPHLANDPHWFRSAYPDLPAETSRAFYQTEAWERSFVGAACYLASGGGNVADGKLAALYRTRLVRGCDPADPEYFGDEHGSFQTGACAALAMLIAPEHFIDPLSAGQLEKVLIWLHTLLARPSPHNNHYFFHIQIAPLLDRCGFSYDRALADHLLEKCLRFYAGGGWFEDGSAHSFDYYNAWGFQYYLLILARFDTGWRQRYGERIRETARLFFTDFVHLFAENGVHVPYGRSQAYRFGAVDSIDEI